MCSVAAASAMAAEEGGKHLLGQAWEQDKRIRKRLRSSQSFLMWPAPKCVPKPKDDEEKEPSKVEENPITTASLALNCPAVHIMFQHLRVLNGKKVSVKEVTRHATCTPWWKQFQFFVRSKNSMHELICLPGLGPR